MFNGFYDEFNYGEVHDFFQLFWVYKQENNLSCELKYINKKDEPLSSFFDYDYIISQATDFNKELHYKFAENGYNVMLRFRHYYFENIDSLFDWESAPDYIVFKKTLVENNK